MNLKRKRAGVGAAVAATAILGLTACGSSNPAAAPTPSPTPTPTMSPSTAVTAAYATFFGGSKDPKRLAAVLQNGDKLAAVIAQGLKSPMLGGLTAKVSNVSLVNPHLATVTFTLLSHGSPLVANTIGKAVLVDGTWKVAAYTYCGLLSSAGPAPAACKAPGVTTLPSS